jgi:hypothetical protein
MHASIQELVSMRSGVAMKTISIFISIFLPYTAFAGRPLSIEDLTVIEESGVSPAELRKELLTTSSSTYPDHITGGDYPSVYTSASNPNSVTAGDIPNAMTRGNFPNQYTTGRPLDGNSSEPFPMPNLDL